MRTVVIAAIAFIFLAGPVHAQSSMSIIGAWERIRREPPDFPAFAIFSADGYFSQSIIPPDRPKGSIQDLTREGLLARYEDLVARYGAYTIEGDQITRHDVGHHNPNLVGRTRVEYFRIEGDMLIISREPGEDREWYRRMPNTNR